MITRTLTPSSTNSTNSRRSWSVISTQRTQHRVRIRLASRIGLLIDNWSVISVSVKSKGTPRIIFRVTFLSFFLSDRGSWFSYSYGVRTYTLLAARNCGFRSRFFTRTRRYSPTAVILSSPKRLSSSCLVATAFTLAREMCGNSIYTMLSCVGLHNPLVDLILPKRNVIKGVE